MRREDGHQIPYNADVRNIWSCNSTPRHSFRSRTEPSPEGTVIREATGGTIKKSNSGGKGGELIVSLKINITFVPIA